jgi:hypothetical protein
VSLARRMVARCPRCDVFLEIPVSSVQLVAGHDEDGSPGVSVEMSGFVAHGCDDIKVAEKTENEAEVPSGE